MCEEDDNCWIAASEISLAALWENTEEDVYAEPRKCCWFGNRLFP